PGHGLLVRVRASLARQAGDGRRFKRIHSYWVGNILERLFPTIFELVMELRTHMLVHRSGHADAARLRQWLETTCYVDAVAMNIVRAGDDIAEIDAYAQFDALRIGEIGVPLGHSLLQSDGTNHRLDGTGKFHQNAVALDPDNPPCMGLDL